MPQHVSVKSLTVPLHTPNTVTYAWSPAVLWQKVCGGGARGRGAACAPAPCPSPPLPPARHAHRRRAGANPGTARPLHRNGGRVDWANRARDAVAAGPAPGHAARRGRGAAVVDQAREAGVERWLGAQIVGRQNVPVGDLAAVVVDRALLEGREGRRASASVRERCRRRVAGVPPARLRTNWLPVGIAPNAYVTVRSLFS